MPAPIFLPLGDDKDDYITVDGQIDWATIPAHTLPKHKVDMPIRMRVGDQSFGDKHIYDGHARWLKKMKRTACELIWEKLSLAGGKFFKGKKNRTVIYVRLTPECLVVLEPQIDNRTNFFSIVTIYQKQPKKGELPIADYSSNFANPKANKTLRKG